MYKISLGNTHMHIHKLNKSLCCWGDKYIA